MSGNRKEWLDIAKGIAIIMMVFGHSNLPKPIGDFIWAFHMPLFFIASGWATNWNDYTLITFCKHRLRSILVPFVVYSTIVLLIQVFFLNYDLKHWLLFGWEGYALWFVQVFFVALIMAKFVVSINDKPLFSYLSILALFAIGAILSYNMFYLPWSISSIPFATALILIGRQLRANLQFENCNNRSLIIYAIGCFFVVIVISHFWRLDVAFNRVVPVVPLTIGALAGTLMVFFTSLVIFRYTNIVSKILINIGRETYLIMAFSQVMMLMLIQYTPWGTLLRYTTLLILLIVSKIIKDYIKYGHIVYFRSNT